MEENDLEVRLPARCSAVLLVLLYTYLLSPPLLPAASNPSVETYNDPNYSFELLPSFGPCAAGSSSEWLSADSAVIPFNIESKSIDEISVNFGLLSFVDQAPAAWPCSLFPAHAPYFVNVPSESETRFSVIFLDPYGNEPAAGYPRISYWPKDTQNSVTLALEYAGTLPEGRLYMKNAPLTEGVYEYKYTVILSSTTYEYSTAISSFAVASRPPSAEIPGLPDNAVSSNGRVELCWNASAGGRVTYRLFIGPDPGALALYYEGLDPSCPVTELDYAAKYYWQVETVNEYGLSSKSRVFAFTTITRVSSAFNYPNPFNPDRGETTRIVFDMKEDGCAELSLLSEYGNLCWHGSAGGLPKGANEVRFGGFDDSGNVLYSGTYVCIIRKKYGGQEETDRCRILVVK